MELSELKRLAGINEFKGYVKYDPVDPYSGSNISVTGNEKRRIEREQNIRPGTPEWFQLWFALPYMTDEKFGDKQWLR